MATTSYQSWAGCRAFGLRDFFEQAGRHPEMPQNAMEAVNQALRDLGFSKYTVESIAAEDPVGEGSATYAVTLALADQSAPAISVRF